MDPSFSNACVLSSIFVNACVLNLVLWYSESSQKFDPITFFSPPKMNSWDASVVVCAGIAACFNTALDMHLYRTMDRRIALPWCSTLLLCYATWAAQRLTAAGKRYRHRLDMLMCIAFLLASLVSEVLGQLLGPRDLCAFGGMYMLRCVFAVFTAVICGKMRPLKAL